MSEITKRVFGGYSVVVSGGKSRKAFPSIVCDVSITVNSGIRGVPKQVVFRGNLAGQPTDEFAQTVLKNILGKGGNYSYFPGSFEGIQDLIQEHYQKFVA